MAWFSFRYRDGTVKIKSQSSMRSREFNREIPVFTFGPLVISYWPDPKPETDAEQEANASTGVMGTPDCREHVQDWLDDIATEPASYHHRPSGARRRGVIAVDEGHVGDRQLDPTKLTVDQEMLVFLRRDGEFHFRIEARLKGGNDLVNNHLGG